MPCRSATLPSRSGGRVLKTVSRYEIHHLQYGSASPPSRARLRTLLVLAKHASRGSIEGRLCNSFSDKDLRLIHGLVAVAPFN